MHRCVSRAVPVDGHTNWRLPVVYTAKTTTASCGAARSPSDSSDASRIRVSQHVNIFFGRNLRYILPRRTRAEHRTCATPLCPRRETHEYLERLEVSSGDA